MPHLSARRVRWALRSRFQVSRRSLLIIDEWLRSDGSRVEHCEGLEEKTVTLKKHRVVADARGDDLTAQEFGPLSENAY